MKYKMCIWDLDGTLLNTLPTLHYFDNETLKAFGLNEISYQDSIGLIKYSISEYYHILLRLGNCKEELIDDILNDFIKYNYNAYKNNCTYLVEEFPGIKDILIELNKLNIINVVATNKFEGISNEIVNTFYKDLLDNIYGQTDDSISKPNKGCLDRLINTYDINKEDMLLIGDTEIDILTARNNDIDCAVVTWGYQDLDVLKEYNPKYIIDNPNDLLNILKEED